ncbi:MAG: protein phosphatase 2C domain-containing protein [Austwickia sp.]|nr:protein phosphatase 2C domain-containing protein [Austwickia sp.]MBK8437143.1 protein phosphatase 2C domain-containing protein [Austwickia sp.]MBK9102377.1 protein phosphatase 2C domain-containing protein [Austwickia sp.]
MTSSSDQPGPRRPADVYAEFGDRLSGPAEPGLTEPDAAEAGEVTEAETEAEPAQVLAPAAQAGVPAQSAPAAASAPAAEPPAAEPIVTGAFTPYRIGDAGRAFDRTVPLPSTAPGGMHDYAMDAATISDPDGTPRLILRGASGRGLAHQQYGDPRQDDFGYALSADGEHVVGVVADGVSAGAWSHLAARLAAEEGSRAVANLLATTPAVDIDWHGLFVMLSERMHDLCATLPSRDSCDVGLTAREVAEKMATTIIVGVVAVRPSPEGTHAVTVVRLGDTSGWIVDEVDGWVALGEVKNQGAVIAESSTACLPLVPDADPLIVETTLADGAALLLLTDGVGDPLGSGKGDVGKALAKQWAAPPHPIEFAGQICFGRKTFDDDRAALGIWPVPGAASAAATTSSAAATAATA